MKRLVTQDNQKSNISTHFFHNIPSLNDVPTESKYFLQIYT